MVVHGPLIFDTGDVRRLMEILHPDEILVAGVMARTAAEESGLPVRFCNDPPSRVIRRLAEKAFLANRGKTVESGRIFGRIVASRLPGSGLVHLECSSSTIYCWDGGDMDLSSALAGATGFPVIPVASAVCAAVAGERVIGGCLPGEPVCVNGLVIGYATSTRVVLRQRKDAIEIVSGLVPKAHGLEKLAAQGGVDLATAWCKSGNIRSVAPTVYTRTARRGRIVTVDHAGISIYERLRGPVCGVLAIGDDTSAVCGHICAHRGIPVLGIVDGDADGIVPDRYPPGSIVVYVHHGRDDDLGREVAALVPDGEVSWDAWVADVLAELEGRVRIVRYDTRTSPPDGDAPYSGSSFDGNPKESGP
ncbi:MAG: DUF2117 domain-containing protein [Methanomicrobiales archaeon]|nr:DUF2117 domain-containing protein [Methanomicrobiales archaeon]